MVHCVHMHICCINLTAATASPVMVDKSAQQRLKRWCSSRTMQIPFSFSAFHLLALYITAVLDTALQLIIVKWLTLLCCECQCTARVWDPRTQRLLYLNSIILLLLLEPSTHTYTTNMSATNQHINTTHNKHNTAANNNCYSINMSRTVISQYNY